ncbi:MAG TPA: DUF4252 domain-containing protein [Xanthomonadales bacterium]|nr:DUF4252 domain-containing protein [Xanthomonadales bacterium]
MKRFKTTSLAAIFGLVLSLLAAPVVAQEDALKSLPGYVDFGELQGVYGEPKVMINLGGSILKFVGGMSKDDPEASELLSKLKGVRINVYSVDGNPDAALEKVSQVKSMLAGSQWEPIVQVNEEGEQAQIFIKLTGDTMEGLTVMAVDDSEAVFINIIGQLDPAQLSQVMDNFDIDIDDHLEVP